MGTTQPSENNASVARTPLLSTAARHQIRASIKPSVEAIAGHKHAMEAALREAGIFEDGDTLQITMGVELEHTAIFGERTARRRISALKALGIDQPTDSKDGMWMPPTASKELISRDIVTAIGSHRENHTHYDVEPAFGPGIGSRIDAQGNNILEAYSPREIISYPLSRPEAAINWLIAMPQRMMRDAGKYDIRKLDFSTRPNDAVVPNSVHMHIAVQIKKKDGTLCNVMSAKDMDHEGKSAEKRPSDIALSIGHRLNALQQHEMLGFAPAEKSTDRFTSAVGPKQIGFERRKKLNGMGTALFRGEGIHAFREEATYGKPDDGPLRIELRVPSAEIIGHPDKERYPQTALFPALAIEQLVRGVREGIDDWVQHRPAKEGYEQRVHDLYAEHFRLPKSQLEVYQQFAKAPSAQAYFGEERHAQILEAVSDLNRAYEESPRIVTSTEPPRSR